RYYFFYADVIDAVGHHSGPASAEFAAAVGQVFTALERFFHEKAAGRSPRTLVLMTADHGQVAVSPETTFYLNRHPELSGLGDCFRTGRRDGKPILFGGSCRDLFLYVKEERLAEVQARLQRVLEGRAEVWRVEELIALGLFGPLVSEHFRQRVGNL